MILRRLHATGFGPLAGEVNFDDSRLNLIVGPNESGKSTLAAAIAAAFYGLDEDRRVYRGRFTPREQFKPWDGSTYAIELIFEVGGKRYTVNRNFERDTVSVYAEGEGDVSEEFRTGPNEYSIGEFLLGVNVDQFVRSGFWLQPGPGRLTGHEVRPDGTLSSMLERQASTVSGDASAQAALNVLDAAVRHYAVGDTRILVSTQIRRLQGALEGMREALAVEEARIDRAGLALGELERTRELEHELEDERRRSVAVVSRRACAEKAALLKRDDEARASVKKLRAERDELAEVPAIEQDAADRLRRAQAELDAARRSQEEVQHRKSESYDQPRAEIEAAIEAQRVYRWAAPVHLDELDEFARERKRIADGREQAAAKRAEVEHELRRAGISVDRLEEQRRRFARLEVPDTKLLTQYPASAQAASTEREEAESAAANALSTMESIGRERRTQRIVGSALLAVGLLAAVFSVWLSLQGEITPAFMGLGGTLLALAGGALFLFRGASLRGEERKSALRALTEARSHLQRIKEQTAERELALSELTRRLGLSSGAELLREHAEYLRMVREGDRFAWVSQDLTRLEAEEEELRRRIWQWAVRAGAAEEAPEPPVNWTIDAALAEMREGVSNMLALRSKLERLEEQNRHFIEQEKSAKVREEKAIASARIVVRDLGTPAGDWEKALTELERRRLAHERRRQIERTLPDLERQVLAPEDRHSTEQEMERLEGELERVSQEHPDWFAAAADDDLSRTDAENRLQQVQVALEEAREKRFSLEKEIGSIEEETEGGGRASQLRLEVAETERDIERADRFQKAIHLAREKLQSVARETHALWSEFLSRRVNELLPVLGPAYRGFEVTDNLEYSLVAEGQRLDRPHLEQVLSAGTRDQLSLALRIAVCEFLARGGESLPLIFDDPFSSGDDERAEAGLHFLAEAIAPSRQLLVLTCHQGRVEALRSAKPAWFEKHVHQIDTPIAAAAPGSVHMEALETLKPEDG